MNIFTVPLAPAHSQRFTLVLSGVRYGIRLRWNPILNLWVMDISDASFRPLANGIAVVAGADLLNQFSYLEFAGGLMAQRSENANLPPSHDGLGITDGIYYIPYNQGDQAPFTREI